MAEETIYSDNNVSVTTARVVVGGTTYALRNITSVKMTMTSAEPSGCAPWLGGIGILGVIGGILGIGNYGFDVGAFIGALICCGMVVASIFQPNDSEAQYHVTFTSSSGETDALTCENRSYIVKIITSINEAIVRYLGKEDATLFWDSYLLKA